VGVGVGRIDVRLEEVPGVPGGRMGLMDSPCRMKRHFPPFVIGSLYSWRRNFPLTRTSSDGGSAFPLRC